MNNGHIRANKIIPISVFAGANMNTAIIRIPLFLSEL
jgi:hypothetical protein